MDKRYRIVPPPQGSEPENPLMDRIYAEIPADQPELSLCPEGEWLCGHALCPVRVVRLCIKAPFHLHPPSLRCPLCLRTLEFRHWLNVVALREVPAAKRGVRARQRQTPLSTVERRRGGLRRERGEAAS